ncbi:hypothetical protein LDENG_00113960 [Lucifuga dentata]|nr:hypothetical protein LDENG_00113960 [Lucifuga dentata]
MAQDRPSSDLDLTVESTHLVKILLERRRQTFRTDQEVNRYDNEMRNINWVACKDFTVAVGKKQIAEYIQTWDMKPCWLYSLDFLCSTEEGHHTFYHYRARWSTPTPLNPIQGTASVYFVVDIPNAKPQTLPVEVHFVVESNRLVHTAGRTRFSEKWLTDIIKTKAWLRSLMDF